MSDPTAKPRIPQLANFTDAEIAVALQRLGIGRIKGVVLHLWGILEVSARAALVTALRASPDFAGAVVAQAAGSATKNFVEGLLGKGDKRP